MKKTLLTILCATSIAVTPSAFAAKKNDPNRKEVQTELEEIQEGHYVERMKISQLCTLDFEDADGEDIYYHFYTGTLKSGKYHLIIYDNTPSYLGYYLLDFEPADYEEGTILLDSGESTGDGATLWHEVVIKSTGPIDKIRVDGVPVSFVKNPKLEADANAEATAETGGIPAVPKETAASGEVIDYRDWTITIKGNTVTVNAIFVEVKDGKVTIKNSKNGKEAHIPGSALSEADREYVKRITGK